MIWPDDRDATERGFRAGRACGSSVLRDEGAGPCFAARILLPRRFSHSLSSLRKVPSAQTILLQRSPSTRKPCSQMRGQTRSGFCLIASSASELATLVSNLVPAYRLNFASERSEAAFQSPSAAPVRQPTRRNSPCAAFAISAGDGPVAGDATPVSFAAWLAGLADVSFGPASLVATCVCAGGPA